MGSYLRTRRTLVSDLAVLTLTLAGSHTSAWASVTATATVTVVDPNTPPAVVYSPVAPPGQQTVTGTTTATAHASANGPSTFATADATGKIVAGKLTKTPTGSAGAKAGFSLGIGPPARSATWTSTVTGTVLQIRHDPSDPNPTVPVTIQLTFPSSGDPSLDPYPDTTFSGNLGGAAPPSQGVVRDNANLNPALLASFFDITYTVHSTIAQSGAQTPLFDGSVVFHPNGTITRSGGFNSVIDLTDQNPGANPFATRTVLQNLPTITTPFELVLNQDFNLSLDVAMSMGDPNNPGSLPPNLSGRALAAGGSFAAIAQVVNFSNPSGQAEFYNLVPVQIPGDFNQDGALTAADIHELLVAAANPTGYRSAHNFAPEDFATVSDLNGDHHFTNHDLQAMLNSLKGGSILVPEPSGIVLSVLGGLAFVGIRRRRRCVI